MQNTFLNSLLAEETGWHIGDGSMNYYLNKNQKKGLYQLRGHYYDDRLHYDQRIKPVFEKIYQKVISLRDMKSTGVYGFQVWDDSIVNQKVALGLPLGKKYDITIPDEFFHSLELAKSTVRGIFDTDGSVYLEKRKKLYPRIKITTTSEPLAEQIMTILYTTNLKPTVHREAANAEKNRPNPEFIVELRGESQTARFFKTITPRNPKHLQKFEIFRKSF